MPDTFVIGWDGSDRARDALALAAGLAGPEGRAIAAYCLPLPSRRGSLDGFEEILAGDAAEVLMDARDAEVIGDDRLALRVVPDASPARGLAELADVEGADLIVVGSGGIAKRLMATAPCPVAVAPPEYGVGAKGAPRVVGVAFDSSAESRRALALAERLALDTGASMRVICVDKHWFPDMDISLSESAGVAHERLRSALDDAVAALDPRTRAQAKLVGGNAMQALLAEVTLGLDVLVMGARGMGAIRRALLGSVSRSVVDAQSCPVIVVPASELRTAASPRAADSNPTLQSVRHSVR